jgi:hypothetical protein
MRTLKALAACAAIVISMRGGARMVTQTPSEGSGPFGQISDLLAP